MNRDRLSHHLLIAFLMALVLYVAGFWFIESRRVAESPWVVGFQTNADGQVVIDIRQKSLGLGPVEIRIETTRSGGAVARQEVVFDTPRPVPFAVPEGQCIFQDATFLPGTVALEIAGVAIQLIPRALTIGTNEFAWAMNGGGLVPKGSPPRIVE
jgi:hypothetical protein